MFVIPARPQTWRIVFAAILVCICNTAPVVAQNQPATLEAEPDYQSLLQRGVDFFKEQKYREAAVDFNDAANQKVDDPRAHIMLGYALNRLGRFNAAFESLRVGEEMGAKAPRRHLELGWAAERTGRFGVAIERLRQYETARPGSAKAAELLGRAYLGRRDGTKNDLVQAEKWLREALRRDPATAKTVHYFLAQVAAAGRDGVRAGEELNAMLRDAPDAPLSKALRQLSVVARKQAAAAARPWRLSASLALGHNSNVIGRGDNQPLPTGISDEASGFWTAGLNGSYSVPLSAGSAAMTVGYGHQSTFYFDLHNFDAESHQLHGDYVRRLSDKWGFALRAFGQYLLTDGDSTLRRVGLRPTLAFRWNKLTSTEYGAYLAGNDYMMTPGSANFDRDGSTQSYSLSQRYNIPDSVWRLQGGVTGLRNSATGNDFEYSGYSLFGAVSGHVGVPVAGRTYRLFLHGIASFGENDYAHLNSLSGTTGFAFQRKDQSRQIGASASLPIRPGMEAYAQLGYTNTDSNIVFFDYTQRVGNLGLTLRF